MQTFDTKYFTELFEFLSIPSISTQPSHLKDIMAAANYLKNYTESIGLDNCQLIETDGYPVVFAEKLVDEALPTVLIYGHYDVQPADPIELWESPPFKPEIRATNTHPDGAIFARGACDDKGQLFIPLKAFEALALKGEFPCNYKFIFEGEEEIGSVSLPNFIKANEDLLKSDALLVCDTAMINKDTPALIYKLKGAGLIDIKLTSQNPDLHSGIYGGIAPNPAIQICKIVAELVTHFQNSINTSTYLTNELEVTSLENAIELPQLKNGLKLHPDVITQHIPTMEVNGITSGYTGKGHKTVIPNEASVKISVRSAIGESTDQLLKRLTAKINSLQSVDFKLTINTHNLCDPIEASTITPEFIVAKHALESTFKNKPKAIGIGGSIPIVSMFKNLLNMDSVLMGFGLNSDDIHSPNEHFGIDNFKKGVNAYTHFFENYALEFEKQSLLVGQL